MYENLKKKKANQRITSHFKIDTNDLKDRI